MSFKLKDIVSEEHFKILRKLNEIFSYRYQGLNALRFHHNHPKFGVDSFAIKPTVSFKINSLGDSELRKLQDSFERIDIQAPFLFGSHINIKVSGLKP